MAKLFAFLRCFQSRKAAVAGIPRLAFLGSFIFWFSLPQRGAAAEEATPKPLADTHVHYVGAEEFSELMSLADTPGKASVPVDVRANKIESLRTAFASSLRENQSVVSEAVLLALEALLLQNRNSARLLVRRYGNAGLPKPLQSLMTFEQSKALAALATPSSTPHEGVTLRLHRLWWEGPRCRVAIQGVFVAPLETPSLLPGQHFYAQRICEHAEDNRLAQGHVPSGKETLYIGFRTETLPSSDGFALASTPGRLEPSNGRRVPEAPETHSYRTGAVGLLSGLARARLGAGGERPGNPTQPGAPFFLHGLRLFTSSSWALVVQGSSVTFSRASSLTPKNTTKETRPRPRPRFLARASLEWGRTFALGPTADAHGTPSILESVVSDSVVWRPLKVHLRPTLGLGLTHLSRGTHTLDDPLYLAPHGSLGLELSMSPWTPDLTLSVRPSFSWAPPPFSGTMTELLLGLTVVL